MTVKIGGPGYKPTDTASDDEYSVLLNTHFNSKTMKAIVHKISTATSVLIPNMGASASVHEYGFVRPIPCNGDSCLHFRGAYTAPA